MRTSFSSLAGLWLLAGCASAPLTSAPSVAAPAPLAIARTSPGGGANAARGALQPPQDDPDQGRIPWGSDDSRSDLIPIAELLAFQVLLNRYDRNFDDEAEAYDVDIHSWRRNLEGGWRVDRDPFGVNQLGHPYSGATYHGIARSTGHEFWEASAYTFTGSVLWEVFGETGPPSINDQIHTGIGGAFLGEALFRTASWLLEAGGETPGTLRELGALALSPPTSFNRWVFGERFRGVFPSRQPAVASRIGGGLYADVEGADRDRDGREAVAQFAIDYGLPSQSGYRCERPFDCFHMQLSMLSAEDNRFDRVDVRGMLLGSDYEFGNGGRGLQGLFGSYDYLSPGPFRVASTSLGYGTTASAPVWSGAELRLTSILGIGFGAAGTVADDFEDRDYHHGVMPQALLDLQLLQSRMVTLQATLRDFVTFGVASSSGRENVLHAELALTLRVVGPHALRVEYVTARRDADYGDGDDGHRTAGNLFVSWAFLGGTAR